MRHEAIVIAGLIITFFTLIAAQAARQLRNKTFYAFDPLMFFWVGATLVYPVEMASNSQTYINLFGPAVMMASFGYLCIGTALVIIGYNLSLGRKIGNKIPAPPVQLHRGKTLAACLSIIAIGVAGWMEIINSSGGLYEWASIARGAQDFGTLSAYVGEAAQLVMVGVPLLILHCEMHKRGLLLTTIAWVIAATLFVFFFYLGSRSRTIGVVLGSIMAWSLPRRKSPPAFVLMAMGIGLFFLVNFQASYRSFFKDLSFNFGDIEWSEVPYNVLPRFVTGVEGERQFSKGSELGVTAATLELVPDSVPYSAGYEFLQLLTQPIPKQVWPEKRYPRGELWSEIHSRAGTSEWLVPAHKPFLAGPAPGFVASWYMNGGLIGIGIGSILTGVLLRVIRSVFDRAKENQGFAFIYLIAAPVGFSEAVSHPFQWAYTVASAIAVLVALMAVLSARKIAKTINQTQ